MVQQLAAEFVCFVGTPESCYYFGFDMPLKIQDALVNAFVVLYLI